MSHLIVWRFIGANHPTKKDWKERQTNFGGTKLSSFFPAPLSKGPFDIGFASCISFSLLLLHFFLFCLFAFVTKNFLCWRTYLLHFKNQQRQNLNSYTFFSPPTNSLNFFSKSPYPLLSFHSTITMMTMSDVNPSFLFWLVVSLAVLPTIFASTLSLFSFFSFFFFLIWKHNYLISFLLNVFSLIE